MLLQFLVAIFIILLIVDQWKPRKYWKLHKELGNDWKYVPFLGNAWSFTGNNEDMMTALIQLAFQANKRKHKAVSVWLGPKLCVFISDGDQANMVLRTAHDKHIVYKVMKPIVGNGSGFAPGAIFGGTSDTLRTFDRTFSNAFSQFMKYLTDHMLKPFLHIDAIYVLLPVYARLMKYKKIIYQYIDNMIYAKQELLAKNDAIGKADERIKTDKPKPSFNTILELMVKNSKKYNVKGYTHEELREEIIVLAVAGSDTAAVGTSFTMLLLAQHPDIQDKVYKEIQEILGDPDKPLEAKDLIKLTYTTAVIKESLRLYPPVTLITRHCQKDIELPSGVVLPAGCDVIINILGVQRNPDYWGEDANEFKPERFLSGHVPSNGFIAFGLGPRNCIGQQYGMLIITTMLVTVLRRFHLKPATNVRRTKDNQLRLTYQMVTKEVNDFAIQVERRKH